MNPSDDWLNVNDGARHVGFGPKRLRREVRDGRLRAARIGKVQALRFRRAWLDEWMESFAPLIHAKVNDGQSLEEVSSP